MEDRTAGEQLTAFGDAIEASEMATAELRKARNEFFLYLWNSRQMTVKDMSRHSGIRRESVHDALRKAKANAAQN